MNKYQLGCIDNASIILSIMGAGKHEPQCQHNRGILSIIGKTLAAYFSYNIHKVKRADLFGIPDNVATIYVQDLEINDTVGIMI